MTKRMLIDAAHPEETRVVVADGNQLEDFDVEVSSRRQLKGNIYLAKVVRVEPSLQAAFVDYGGNRHGFLAFSEIHPDYYQIPVADRPEEEEALAEEAEAEETVSEAASEEPAEDGAEAADESAEDGENGENGDTEEDGEGESDGPLETLGGDESDEVEASHKRRPPNAKQYKIQEVIKRRQVLLVQVVKEERGNKGAALTTYMSLAGRYCVLMPNTSRGGGISRKITNSADRKSLKAILSSLDVPEGMAVILRTAGIGRTKAEIKRDFEYLIRLWNNVRDLTLQSTAPTLVHEEGDIVRRSIRDLYSRDIDDILVEGDDAYRAAKDFMKLLIPSHARRVKQYKETDAPLFRSAGVENQLDAIHNPIVHLPSGGYLVINPTEALVSIDVNSGRSTKERNIEETALKTNLEAAEELARQLRLRDLAGLVVVDFIDMDVNRNNSQVERRMKEALKHDRARIQVGRISPFGLLEMSRQRLRPSLIETSSEPCPHCGGTGIRRSTESTALVVLRAIDEEGANRRAAELTVHVPTSVALYILNHKRDALAELQAKHGMAVLLTNDDSLIPPDLRLERTKNQDGETISEMVATVRADAAEDAGRKRRRRRRGRKRDEDGTETQVEASESSESSSSDRSEAETSEDGEEKKGKRRRRSRRGGRRRRKSAEAIETAENAENAEASETGDAGDEGSPDAVEAKSEDAPAEGEEKPKRRRSRRRRKPANGEAVEAASEEASSDDKADVEAKSEDAPAEDEKPKRRRRSRKKKDETVEADAADANEAPAEAAPEAEEKPKPKRTRTRKKKADGEDKAEDKAEKKADPKPKKVEAAPEATSEPASEDKPAANPAIDTVVVGETADKPKRKGWWNIGG